MPITGIVSGAGKRNFGLKDAIMADYERIRKGLNIRSQDEIEYYERNFNSYGHYKTYLDTGYYAEQIERYLKLFPRENMKIFMFEDLCKDPKGVVRECVRFLGADSAACEGFDCSARNTARLLRMNRKKLRQLYVNFVYNRKESSFIKRLVLARRRPEFTPELRKWLAEHFRSHNERLEKIIGRKLDHWV